MYELKSETKGILFKISAGIVFTLMGAMVKYLGDTVSISQIVFARAFFSIIPILIFLYLQGQLKSCLKTNIPMSHFYRSLLGILAMVFMFITLRYLSIAESTTLSYLSPIILVIISYIFLKEKITIRCWWALLISFVGILIMMFPKFSNEHDSHLVIGIIFGIAFATFKAIAMLQVRNLKKHNEKTGTITLYFAITSTIISGISLFWFWVNPSMQQWVILIGIGLTGGISQLLITISFSYASAATLAVYEYLNIIWAVFFGVVLFADIPDYYFWIACIFIISSTLLSKTNQK